MWRWVSTGQGRGRGEGAEVSTSIDWRQVSSGGGSKGMALCRRDGSRASQYEERY